jgi:hypothetical protein
VLLVEDERQGGDHSNRQQHSGEDVQQPSAKQTSAPCLNPASIAAVLGSDVIIGLAIGAAPQRQCALVPEAHVTGPVTWPGSVKGT